eukprot:PLAT10660.3.p1 GENE.PLAT10660.3~~PLAT10660.3.p1  ORF type:complete len:188 (-),score=52.17 PLAT10660.3:336-899(-)
MRGERALSSISQCTPSLFRRVFFPLALGLNAVRHCLAPAQYDWFTQLQPGLLLSALPLRSQLPLLRSLALQHVFILTEAWEEAVTDRDWQLLGVQVHRMPCTDYGGSASQHQLRDAVATISRLLDDGQTVLVHCKAGRGRSAVVCACYYVAAGDSAAAAVARLKRARPQVSLARSQYAAVAAFAEGS